jgi:hypothetical protein
MRNRGLFIAIGLLLLVNALVLVGVRYNRSGAPDSVMTLTNREMPIAYSYQKEDSGISLRVRTDHYFYGWSTGVPDEPFAWIDRKKLETLGFDFSHAPDTDERYGFYNRQLPRRAYAVLEYDGPAWEGWKRKLTDEPAKSDQPRKEGAMPATSPGAKQKNIEQALRTDSHLFIIDAGTDSAALRRQYPDQKHYLILPAKVRVSYVNYSAGKDAVRGYVEILTSEVNVPHRLHATLGEQRKQGNPFGIRQAGPEGEPGYQVVLHTGKRYEPWIEAVMPIR